MTDALISSRLTVEHAKTHIQEVELLAKGFFESEPHAVFTEPDPLHATHDLQYLRLVKPLPLRIPGLARDAVNNLRSALDQIGFDIAIAAGRSGKNAHFPFGATLADVESRRRQRSKDIPEKVFDLMVAFKPYHGGNDTLWRLNKLANSGKHETFIRAVLFTSEITYESRGMSLSTGTEGRGTEDELVIGWIRRGEPQPYHDLKLTTSIRFNDVDGIAFERPAIELLHDFSRVVDRIIVAVEAEARRLGIFN